MKKGIALDFGALKVHRNADVANQNLTFTPMVWTVGNENPRSSAVSEIDSKLVHLVPTTMQC